MAIIRIFQMCIKLEERFKCERCEIQIESLEMKHIIDGINGRLDIVDVKLSEREDVAIEIT